MQKNLPFALTTSLILTALIFTGCGKTILEQTAEEQIETATGGNADVDLSNDGASIKTEGGTYQSGSAAELPSNFDNDAYVIDGTIIGSFSDTKEKTYWVMIETTQSIDNTSTEYQTKLTEKGWTITGTLNYGTTVMLTAEKGTRKLAVTISAADDKTTVTMAGSPE